MQHPDEGTIHAWLDGALSPEESASLEAHAATCAECSAAIAEARGLIAASTRIVSALDIVPGGVIPSRKQVARPWYASTQLRAAAAVIFVAGASFLLVRDRGSESLSDVAQRVMTEQAPAAVQAEQDVPATTEAATAQPEPERTATANSARREVVAQRKSEVSQGSPGAAGSAAGAAQSATDVAPLPPPAPAPMAAAAPPVAELRDTSRLVKAAVTAAPVVVTGVAASAQKVSSDLRVLGVDSTAGARVTRYRIASGAELTLTEGGEEFTGRGLAARERRFDVARPSAPVPAPVVAESQAAAADASRAQMAAGLPVLTVTWTDPANQRVYTLAGRVSKETLEEVKAKIQEEKRQQPATTGKP